MLRAAEDRQDHEMILIMMSYPDLFAYDAKYHKDCYNTYEGANNVKAAKRKVEREPD